MLPGHLADTHVGSDYDHGVIWHEADQPKHGRFEILLMTTQVKESYQTLRVLGDVSPRLILVGVHMLHLHLVVIVIEAHDLLTDT